MVLTRSKELLQSFKKLWHLKQEGGFNTSQVMTSLILFRINRYDESFLRNDF